MAKKKKIDKNGIQADDGLTTSSIEESSNEINDSELDDLLEESSDPSSNSLDGSNPTGFLSRITPEMKDKLDKIDSLEKHCVELEEENSKLTASIDSYLEEIDKLKAVKVDKTADDSKNALVDLRKELDEARKEISEMRKSLKELRDENDSYLIKISELTFENAKLTCQLQEIGKSMSMAASPTHGSLSRSQVVRPNTATMQNQSKYANPYLQNGYQDW